MMEPPLQSKGNADDMKIVLESLLDTFVKYLSPSTIIHNSPFLGSHEKEFHPEKPDSEELAVEKLLQWVLENDNEEQGAVFHFTDALHTLTEQNGKEGASKENELHQCAENLTHMIDGRLTKQLSIEDVDVLLNSLCEKKFISAKDCKTVKEESGPYESCLKMFKLIRRRKPEWPFVFIEILHQIRPDLMQKIAFQHTDIHYSTPAIEVPADSASLPTNNDDNLNETKDQCAPKVSGKCPESITPIDPPLDIPKEYSIKLDATSPDQAMSAALSAPSLENLDSLLMDHKESIGLAELGLPNDSTEGVNLSGAMSSYSEFSEISETPRQRKKMYVPKEEIQSLSWQMMITNGAVNMKMITTDPPETTQRKHFLQRNASFSDEDDDDDEEENDEPKSESLPKPEPPALNLRKYQEELAEKALKGRNTIICAPTGCGKTRVAVHIILNHFQQQQEGEPKRKVAFLARTVPLVMQQYKTMKKYLSSLEVTNLTGDSEDSMHLHMLMPDNDIIVMTPRILENHMKRKCLPHLGCFSMLIFDECHHTRKGEPYNTLMCSYLKTKKNSPDVKLPQIVGLTASIGVEKAVQDEEAVNSILQVCANLDADNISTVEKYETELLEKVPVPEELMFKLKERDQDDTVDRFLKNIEKLEGDLTHHANELKHDELYSMVRKIPTDKKSQQYGQWAVKIKGLAKSLPRREGGETNISIRALIVIADCLTAYNVVLETLDLAQLKDAMTFLENYFVKYRTNDKRPSFETKIYDDFLSLKTVMKGRLDEENPNLLLLSKHLLANLLEPGSRGIIFVRTRALTDALSSWLNRCGNEKLKSLKAAVFTGTGASVDQGGMTQRDQEETIQKFKTGEVRLLVATSVGEEGLDIPECNLVIKYNHVGNEVTTVQTRGRSRKYGGKSILLAMDKILRKERINQEKAKMMTRAIKQIRQMKCSKIQKKNKEHQERILKDEEILEMVKQQEESRLSKQPFKMECLLCRKLVIDSEDIKTILGSHRIVVDSHILSMIKVYPYKDAKYFDDIRMIGTVRCKAEPEEGKQCGHNLGSIMIYSKTPFVVLQIESFGFDTGSSRGLETFNQWKKVPYSIQEIEPEDIKRYLPQKQEVNSDDDEEDEADEGDDGDDDTGGHSGRDNIIAGPSTGSEPGIQAQADSATGQPNAPAANANMKTDSRSITHPKHYFADHTQDRVDSGLYSTENVPVPSNTEVKAALGRQQHIVTYEEQQFNAQRIGQVTNSSRLGDNSARRYLPSNISSVEGILQGPTFSTISEGPKYQPDSSLGPPEKSYDDSSYEGSDVHQASIDENNSQGVNAESNSAEGGNDETVPKEMLRPEGNEDASASSSSGLNLL